MKTLKEQLQEFSSDFKTKAPQEAQDLMQKSLDDLAKTSLVDTALKTGDTLPTITLKNIQGNDISIQEILKENRLMLFFYRGGWCPYCNLELQSIQSLLPEFESKGIKVVAISPETIENAAETSKKHSLGFEVLSDTDNKIAKSLGLVYQIPDELNQLYLKFGIDLSKSQNNNDHELPVAASYIVEQDGKISYHFLDEDYKKRAEPSEILEKL